MKLSETKLTSLSAILRAIEGNHFVISSAKLSEELIQLPQFKLIFWTKSASRKKCKVNLYFPAYLPVIWTLVGRKID